MNLKGLLGLSTSLMMVCTGLMPSFAHAEDYVTKSQVDVANGVAGLNAKKQVTADVNSNNVYTDLVQLKKYNDRLRFITNSYDTNNNQIDMFYNRDVVKDASGNITLDPETFYFTNSRYGNNYKFNGNVKTSGSVTANGSIRTNGSVTAGGNITASNIASKGDLSSDHLYIGNEKLSPYNSNSNPSLVFLSYYGYDNANIRPNTLMLGGNTNNSIVGLKASCQNTSGGDLGGSCYQFTDMGGLQTVHRSGAGDTDGINVDMRSTDNSPLDSIGGNALDIATYTLKGNSYHIVPAVPAQTKVFQVKGKVECGESGSYCEMSGTQVSKEKAQSLQMITVRIKGYDTASDVTTLELDAGYYLTNPLNTLTTVTINVKVGQTIKSTSYFYPVYSKIIAGSYQLFVKGSFGCGVGGGLSRCEISGINILDVDGNPVQDSLTKQPLPVKVTVSRYDPKSDTTMLTLQSVTEDKITKYYTLANDLTAADKATITFYSADGMAYGVSFSEDADGSQHALIYPALSQSESGLLEDRMAIWTNIANGMSSIEGKTGVDMPNYYYGYYAGSGPIIINQDIDKTLQDELKNIAADTTTTKAEKEKLTVETEQKIRNNQYTKLNVQTYYYPNIDKDKNRWRTINKNNFGVEADVGIPFSNSGDQYDYQLTYKKDAVDVDVKHNSNFHQYSQPTLFLGLNRKNFNLYTLQYHTDAKDSITREYDNEWDFWINSSKGKVSSKGLTLTWSGSGNLEAGSYMMRLAGFNLMPTGLIVDGVNPYGGKSITTDAGFVVFNNAYTTNNLLPNINDTMVISALGQANTNKGAYQLFNYISKDGDANHSLHLGITKSTSGGLQYNQSPTCNDNGKCSVLGQVIFDPLNYVGGVALGSGQGKNTKLGLVVDKNNNVIVNSNLTVDGKSVNDMFDNAVVKSQIDVANGVAGLNTKKQVTADVNSSNVYTDFLQLKKYNDRLRFITNSYDTNNNQIDMFYNRDVVKDASGNITLDPETFYFTNGKYGNNYKFHGNVSASYMIKADTVSGKTIQLPMNGDRLRFVTNSYDTNNNQIDMFYNRDVVKDASGNITLDPETFYFTNGKYGNNYKFNGDVSANGMTTNKMVVKTTVSSPQFVGSLGTPASSSATCTVGEFKDDTNYHYVCVATNKWKRVALSDF